jgi:murein DD-endopeptidase MepM/ murein hydrolase activator NlpD
MTTDIKNKRRDPKQIILIALLFLCLSLGLAFFLVQGTLFKARSGTEINQIALPAPPLPPPSGPALREKKEIIKKGKTLADILKRFDFQAAEIHRLREDIRSVYDLQKIKAGNEIRLLETPDGEFRSLEYSMDAEKYLQVRKESGKYVAQIKELPIEIQLAIVRGRIEDNPISALEAEGEKGILAMEMANLFAWDIDFYTELRKGDSFKLVFEKKFLFGKFMGYGNILTAEFVNQGKILQAFRFTYPDTKKSDYFDAKGNSLRKEFLKSPLKYGQITSRFSFSRLHPIYKVYRAHFGVDYAAPIGQPVQATGDGVVTFAGWNSGSGRMVKVRHKNSYETMYLHLSRIAVREGERISGGDIIGNVGSSGDSTGPHLDYRIRYHGSYINPLGWRFQPAEPLKPEFKEPYRRETETYLYLLDYPLYFASAWANLF